MIKFHSYELLSEYPELDFQLEKELPRAEEWVRLRISNLGVKDASIEVLRGITNGFLYKGTCGNYSGEVMLNETEISFSSKDLEKLASVS